MGKLTLKAVEAARREPGRHYDGERTGLHLQVTGTGAASWCFRFERGGREQIMGLGSLGTFNLIEARERARKARQQLADGINPIEARRTAKAAQLAAEASEAARSVTFKAASIQFHKFHKVKWKSVKHSQQFLTSLENCAWPVFGHLAVGDVDRTLILRAIEPRWHDRTETMSRVRGRIQSVLDFATVRGWRSGPNPAQWTGNLAHVLPAPSTITKVVNLAALPYVDLPSFYSDLAERGGTAALALRFLILTACRTGDVIGATWNEIDLKERVWSISAERMKAGKPHRCPLSDEALAIVQALPRESDYVFPGWRGEPMTNMAMAATLKRMNRRDITVHGFRSCFKDWASERTNYPNEVSEMALAHAVGNKVEQAYRRGDLLARRVRIMADYAKFILEPQVADATVTPIGRRA
jgi:integrase